MFLHQPGNRKRIAIAVSLLLATASAVQAAEVKTDACGVVEGFGGRLQLISADRRVVTEPAAKAPVPCGAWVSTAKGWGMVRHRGGFTIKVGSDSFFQLKDDKDSQEHGVLYRGQVYAEALPGSGEFRVLTANGRVRVERGPAVVVFDSKEEQTQLIALGNSASLENRFSSSRRMKLRAGELTSMNFKRLRVVPSAPAPVSVAGLKHVLAELSLSSSEMELALKSVKQRGGNRSIASTGPSKQPKAKVASAPAPSKAKVRTGYERHRAGAGAQDQKIKDHFVRKLSAGNAAGEEILFPANTAGRSPSSLIQVEPVQGKGPKMGKGQEDEKQKLIDELTRIRGD